MIADFLSGSPSPSPGPRREAGPDADSFSRQARQSPSEGSNEPAGSSFGAGLDPSGSVASAGSSRSGGRKRHRRTSAKTKSGTRRRSSGRRSRSESEEATTTAEVTPAAEEGAESPRRPRRRRRSRSKKTGSAEETSTDEPAAESGGEDGEDASPTKKKRRRGTRGGRRRRKKAGSTAVEIEAIPGEDDDLPVIAELPEEAVLIAEDEGKQGTRTRGGRKKKATKTRRKSSKSGEKKKTTKAKRSRRRRSTDEDDDTPATVEEEPSSVILVNAVEPEETRVAVVADGRILDLQMSVQKRHSYVSDIYRGRVVNLEPAIGAAFVDFGQGRNGFLHASDVLASYGDPSWSLDKLLTTPVEEAEDADFDAGEGEEPEAKKSGGKREGRGRGRGRRQRQSIDKLLKKGQMVVVQITKDAIGDKGPTLTTYVSIPGRYLVLMPSLERTGVSRKIDDDKRAAAAQADPLVPGHPGGDGGHRADRRDRQDEDGDQAATWRYLLLAWEDFSKSPEVAGATPLRSTRSRTWPSGRCATSSPSETEKVVVDDDEVYDRMVEFTETG